MQDAEKKSGVGQTLHDDKLHQDCRGPGDHANNFRGCLLCVGEISPQGGRLRNLLVLLQDLLKPALTPTIEDMLHQMIGALLTSTHRRKLRSLPSIFIIAQGLLHQLNLGGKTLSQYVNRVMPSFSKKLKASRLFSANFLLWRLASSPAWPAKSFKGQGIC